MINAIHADKRRCKPTAMITANICGGRVLKTSFDSGVFNTHAGFKPEKLTEVIALVNPEGEQAFTEESLTDLNGFAELRRWLANQETSYLDNRIRKFQAYSEIGNKPLPHYAMGLDIYATWTSPNRKYGDMINHRLLKAHILAKGRWW